MKRTSRFLFCSLVVAVVLNMLQILPCAAQPSSTGTAGGVWQSANSAVKGVREKGAKKISGLRKWRDHLKQWGLDSSYNHSLSLAGRLASDGYGGGLTYKRRRGEGKTSSNSYALYQLRFSEIKGEKEVSQQRDNTAFPQLGPGTPYIFGKVANCYTLQLGYGRERLLLPGVLEGNTSVSIRYLGGVSLAMLKPYYLELITVDYNTTPATATKSEQAYSERNKTAFLNPALILGRGRWKSGLNGMSCGPGLFGEAAVAIAPGRGKGAFVQTIILGISGAVYSRPLTIMAEQTAYSYEGCLFAALELGKRWK